MADKLVEDARKSVEDGLRLAAICLCFGWMAFSERVAQEATRIANDAGESVRRFGTLFGK